MPCFILLRVYFRHSHSGTYYSSSSLVGLLKVSTQLYSRALRFLAGFSTHTSERLNNRLGCLIRLTTLDTSRGVAPGNTQLSSNVGSLAARQSIEETVASGVNRLGIQSTDAALVVGSRSWLVAGCVWHIFAKVEAALRHGLARVQGTWDAVAAHLAVGVAVGNDWLTWLVYCRWRRYGSLTRPVSSGSMESGHSGDNSSDRELHIEW
jgi:hypothetical protein